MPKITPKQTLIKISKENNIPLKTLQAANPGVVTVKTGQVIKLPKLDRNVAGAGALPANRSLAGATAGAGVAITPANRIYAPENIFRNALTSTGNYITNQSGFNPTLPAGNTNPNLAPAPMVNTNVGGAVNIPRTPTETFNETRFITNRNSTGATTGGTLRGAGPGQRNPLILGQGNTSAGAFSTTVTAVDPRLDPVRGANPGYRNSVVVGQTSANQAANQAAGQATVQLAAPRPVNPDGSTPVFTGNPDDPNTKKWRDYWNNVAALGGDPNIPAAAPVVMTREEIWLMKAEARRRRGAADGHTGGGGGLPAPYQYSEQTQSYIPEELARSITWSG